ncbi:ketopantoate reductase family protein [Nannocystaceae bacterium ST9]
MIVVGAGRIGTALHRLDPDAIALIDRTHGWERLAGEPGEPILITVRNDDLDVVLARVPAARRGDLVFVQNGMLRPWLAEQGLAGATRGLLFLAVVKRGDSITPGGVSPFCGPHAAAIVETLTRFDVPAEVVGPARFVAIELEKLIWNCAFGLCCEVFDFRVGEVVERRADELRGLVRELLAVGERVFDVTLELDPLFERLCDYSRSIADYRGAVKEWRWRNGAFVVAARQQGIATPIHDRMLRATGHLA